MANDNKLFSRAWWKHENKNIERDSLIMLAQVVFCYLIGWFIWANRFDVFRFDAVVFIGFTAVVVLTKLNKVYSDWFMDDEARKGFQKTNNIIDFIASSILLGIAILRFKEVIITFT